MFVACSVTYTQSDKCELLLSTQILPTCRRRQRVVSTRRQVVYDGGKNRLNGVNSTPMLLAGQSRSTLSLVLLMLMFKNWTNERWSERYSDGRQTRSPAIADDTHDVCPSVPWLLSTMNWCSLMQDICSNNPNIVYWQEYIADMIFRGHWRSLLVALISSVDTSSY